MNVVYKLDVKHFVCSKLRKNWYLSVIVLWQRISMGSVKDRQSTRACATVLGHVGPTPSRAGLIKQDFKSNERKKREKGLIVKCEPNLYVWMAKGICVV